MVKVAVGFAVAGAFRRFDINLPTSSVDHRDDLSFKTSKSDEAPAFAVLVAPEWGETGSVQLHVCIILPPKGFGAIPNNIPTTITDSSHLLMAETEPAEIATTESAISSEDEPKLVLAQSCQDLKCRQEIESLIAAADTSLRSATPELCEEGEGGTYFLRGSSVPTSGDVTNCNYDNCNDNVDIMNKNGSAGGPRVAVFKPADEEPGAPANPKQAASERGASSQPRSGIFPGTGAIREVAAWVLDHDGFAGVPPTALVSVRDWSGANKSSSLKRSRSGGCDGRDVVGALQRFVPNDGAAWDVGAGRMSARDVHAIGLLDLRMLNTDRHAGNLLVTEQDAGGSGKVRLTPIDHGLALPTTLSWQQNPPFWEWLHWPQAKQPFSEAVRRYVAERVDPAADAERLLALGVEPQAVRNFRIASTWVKAGVAAGWTLYDLAIAVCGKGHNSGASLLAGLVENAERESRTAEEFFKQFEATVLEYVRRGR